MRRTPARTLLVAAALGLGLALLGSAGAADPATDPEFRAMVDQDAKIIQQAADAVDKAASPKEKKVVARNAGSGIKSSACSWPPTPTTGSAGPTRRPTPARPPIRDEAIKIYKAAADGNFKAAADAAKDLADAKPAAERQEDRRDQGAGRADAEGGDAQLPEDDPVRDERRGGHHRQRQEGDGHPGQHVADRPPGAGHGRAEQGDREGRQRGRQEEVGGLQREDDPGDRGAAGGEQEEDAAPPTWARRSRR